MRLLIRLLAAVSGLALLAAGVLLIVEVGWGVLRGSADGLLVNWPAAGDALGQVSWNEAPVRATAAVVGLIGIVLIILALGAGGRDIRFHDPAPEVSVTTDRRSLARLIGHHVREQDGVAGATVTASRRRVRVQATGELSYVGDMRARLTESATRELRELPLDPEPTMSVSVTPSEEPR